MNFLVSNFTFDLRSSGNRAFVSSSKSFAFGRLLHLRLSSSHQLPPIIFANHRHKILGAPRSSKEFDTRKQINMVDLVERLDVLLRQECVSEDYLAPSFQQQLHADFSEMNDTYSYSASSCSTSTSGINEVWREKICEWSYQYWTSDTTN